MAGYYFNRAADGIHDELYAKAIVLDDGSTRAALVACDLGSIPRPIIVKARELITQATGIPGANVMISATHTHTGPVVLNDASLRYRLEGEMLRIAREYADDLPKRIAAAVVDAAKSTAPARVLAGVGNEPSLTFNRRFHMKDGTVGWNPGKLNPNIVRPAGPIDPGVPVTVFEKPDGSPVAVFVNYALHLDTVGGTHYSADYPFTLSSLLEQALGARVMTLFTMGASGNLNHIDVSSAGRQKGHEEAARIGTVLAAEVLKTWKSLAAVMSTKVGVRTEIVALPSSPFEASEVGWARQTDASRDTPKPAPFLQLVKAAKVLDLERRKGEPVPAEVQVITLGSEMAWVGLPGEIFTELGLAIKNASPFRQTAVVSLANDSIGYVPDRKAYSQGNYEPVSARVAAGSGEMLVEAAARLLTGAMPQPALPNPQTR
jgi:neutral ceramidase